MDRAAASRIAHGELALYNPLSGEALGETIDLLDLEPGARVLDVACGRAEVLIRIAERWDVRAEGYDLDEALIDAARAEAARRGVKADLRVAGEPGEGPFDLAVCIASSHALGGFPAALEALRVLVRPGGQVLLGEGYWRQEPSGDYLEVLGGTRDELPDYPGLMAAAAAAGLTPLHATVSGERDWDRYEWTLILNAERWAARNAGDPGAGVLRERAAAARARYTMPGGRETLGFALVLLRRDK
jgi:SAM-dependent methyltransferase